MKERSLLAFTVLAQLGVGAFLALGAVEALVGSSAGATPARAFTDGVLPAIGLVMALALLSSSFHLGVRGGAWRAVRNLRASWLSREILLTLLFTLFASLLAILRRSGAGSPALREVVAITAGACGLGLVYAMARVYRLRTVPRWDTPRTTISFFATTLLLGSLGVASALSQRSDLTEAAVRPPLLALALAAAGLLGAELASDAGGPLHGLRRVLLAGGFALSVGSMLAPEVDAALLPAAFAAALAAEGIGRYQFYVVGPGRPL